MRFRYSIMDETGLALWRSRVNKIKAKTEEIVSGSNAFDKIIIPGHNKQIFHIINLVDIQIFFYMYLLGLIVAIFAHLFDYLSIIIK